MSIILSDIKRTEHFGYGVLGGTIILTHDCICQILNVDPQEMVHFLRRACFTFTVIL